MSERGSAAEGAADRLAAQDVIVRYATCIDEQDFESYRACFSSDAEMHGFGSEVIRGADAWIAFVRETLAPFRATQHLLGPPTVALRGDEGDLRAPLEAQHFHHEPRGRIFTVWGTYRCGLVREGGLWRIRRHRLDVSGTRTSDAFRA
ncbi:MAG: nuclear transport factor 2 family protein [Myxococcota bacterium]|nr:nuclear transport factor 2 family protein [Myxococcota bacterium]